MFIGLGATSIRVRYLRRAVFEIGSEPNAISKFGAMSLSNRFHALAYQKITAETRSFRKAYTGRVEGA